MVVIAVSEFEVTVPDDGKCEDVELSVVPVGDPVWLKVDCVV